MAKKQLVIVGGGMAAGRLLDRLADLEDDRQITLISAEPQQPYNRVLLPEVLSGNCTPDVLQMHPGHWYQDQDFRFIGGDAVVTISAAEPILTLASGSRVKYDELVLATGAEVPLPDISGMNLPGVMVMRTLADTQALASLARSGARIAVIGGGLLGLEAARALATAGASVRVIHRGQWLLNRQVDRIGGGIVQAFFTQLGIDCRLGSAIESIQGTQRVSGIRLTSGDELGTDAVLFATGTTPRDELASRADIQTDQGVLVDARMRTSRDNVFAIGECARVAGEAYAMVEPVFAQATVLARTLSGSPAEFAPPAPATRLKVAGLTVFSAGRVKEQPGPDDIVIRDPARRIYRRLHFHGRQLLGAVLIGDSSGSRAIQACLAAGGSTEDPMGLAFGTLEAAA